MLFRSQVSNLYGIQYLPSLKKFTFDNNGALCNIYSPSSATGLQYLVLENCYFPYLANALNGLTGLTNLEITACTGFTSLSLKNIIQNNPNLVFLRVAGMPALTQLILAPSESMMQLLCYNNALESIDVSGFPYLYQLTCKGNNITELDVSSNTNLLYLYCDPNSALQTIYVNSTDQIKTTWSKPSTANYVVKE